MGIQPQPIETQGSTDISDLERRYAAIRVADQVARDYPHTPGDEVNAGRRLAYNPHARADLIHLLTVLGLHATPGDAA